MNGPIAAEARPIAPSAVAHFAFADGGRGVCSIVWRDASTVISNAKRGGWDGKLDVFISIDTIGLDDLIARLQEAKATGAAKDLARQAAQATVA